MPDTVPNDNVPEPSVTSACPFDPSDVGNSNPLNEILPEPFADISKLEFEISYLLNFFNKRMY